MSWLKVPLQGRRFANTNRIHPMWDPMNYSLLAPTGEEGWDIAISRNFPRVHLPQRSYVRQVIEEEDRPVELEPEGVEGGAEII